MDSSTHEIRIRNWKTVVAQCQSRPEGQTIAEWCAQNNVNLNAYYYWQRRVRRAVYQEVTPALPSAPSSEEISPAFAEIRIHSDTSESTPDNSFHSFCPDAVIHKGCITLGVTNNISSSLLSQIMECINHVG